MADYSQAIDDLKAAAEICQRHVITTPVNGVNSEYPRWPNAWAACEVVWRNYLEIKTFDLGDPFILEERQAVMREAERLR